MKRFALTSGALVLLVLAVTCIGACRSAASSSNNAAGVAANEASGQPQAAAGASTGVQWVTVRDAREQAFSIQVPQGWKTYGGLFRYSNIDARMVVNMTSPDGLTNLQIGDATIPPYRVPGPTLPTGPGVAPYVTAKVFASKYGQARFTSMCQGLVITKSDDMAPKFHPAQQGISHTTGGDVYFSCTKNGASMDAYVYAETMLMGPGGPGSSWLVVTLASVIAPSAQATAAGALLQYSGASLVMNPAWTQMQNQLNNQAIQQINASTQSIIAATNAENAREQAMISALNNDSFNDVINGVQATKDTSTGKLYTTPLGTGGTQWINGNNTVVESGLSPGAGFTQLTPTGH
jgi:hypothetical protein